MLENDPIQNATLVLAGLVVFVLVVALFRSLRRATSSRRREERLTNAFERASYVRRHGSVPVGSQYGIYEDRVRSVNSMR